MPRNSQFSEQKRGYSQSIKVRLRNIFANVPTTEGSEEAVEDYRFFMRRGKTARILEIL